MVLYSFQKLAVVTPQHIASQTLIVAYATGRTTKVKGGNMAVEIKRGETVVHTTVNTWEETVVSICCGTWSPTTITLLSLVISGLTHLLNPWHHG